MGKYRNQKGVVVIEGKKIPVTYRFTDPHTIECEDEHGQEFLTHYKSLCMPGGNNERHVS